MWFVSREVEKERLDYLLVTEISTVVSLWSGSTYCGHRESKWKDNQFLTKGLKWNWSESRERIPDTSTPAAPSTRWCHMFSFLGQPRTVWYLGSCISLRVLGCRYVVLHPALFRLLVLCWDVQCLALLFPTLFSEHSLPKPEAHCFSSRLATQQSLEPVYLCSPTRVEEHTHGRAGYLNAGSPAFTARAPPH